MMGELPAPIVTENNVDPNEFRTAHGKFSSTDDLNS